MLKFIFLAIPIFAHAQLPPDIASQHLQPKLISKEIEQKCIAEYFAKRKTGKQKRELQTLKPVYQKVENPKKSLPLDLIEGDLQNIKTALKMNLSICEKTMQKNNYQSGKNPTYFKFQDSCELSHDQWCRQLNKKMLGLAEESKSIHSFMAKAADQFDWYQMMDSKGPEPKIEDPENGKNIKFTGYYNPEIQARAEPNSQYSVPIYGEPSSDQKKFTRAEINAGALKGKAPVLGYIRPEDSFDFVIMQIQGSGYIDLLKGAHKERFRLNYASANGKPLVMPARVFQCRGLSPEQTTIPAIREYLRQHPDEFRDVDSYNQSYVFFKMESKDKGTAGVSGYKLTDGVSLACDKNVFPYGMPGFLTTQVPENGSADSHSFKQISRLGVCQDTGSAITGNHFDIFWGEGEYAAKAAGTMAKSRGSMFIPIPKDCRDRTSIRAFH